MTTHRLHNIHKEKQTHLFTENTGKEKKINYKPMYMYWYDQVSLIKSF